MEVRSWIFEYADDVHIVELEHDPDSGHRAIKIDGKITLEETKEGEKGGVYKFRINNLPCMLYIRFRKKTYQYDFFTMKPRTGLQAS